MKFYVESVSKCAQRLGTLSEIDAKPSVSIKTPAVMLHTQGGQIPHITHEVFKLVSRDPQILQIPLAGMHTFKEAMQYYEGTISNFIGSKDSLTCLTLQDPCNITKQGHNSTLKVPIWTKNGKVYYDAKSYMDVVESFKPDIYFLLSDGDTNISSSEKRISKSLSNTVSFYKECLERHRKSQTLANSFVIAPVVGGYKQLAREKFLKSILADVKDVGGFLIDGLHNNGPETEFLEFAEIEPVVKNILNKLPTDKLRVIQGCWNPVNVINLVEMGIDLFDSSYCHILTERSAAMTFAIEPTDQTDTYEINLRDAKYLDDFQPILTGCNCTSCTKYSRAYIHHLLSVHELLGPILVMIHNVYHYLRFFEKIRKCVKSNTLQALQVSITEQFQNHQKTK
ncbi:queuine tRNA-ribosyltransferase accessory subunit 2 [Tribolium castaneum]|uniref:Queuine tRNA-ribosyltransferase accessory subunit 2 n=1 Tax=Tribolium castaneum TaxID=7070 RepID=D6WEE4_TRICA|nr:PREDICTED: queuine tRNA-ribosyltransferase subunit QTRTD1 homolog [Tribolium castaneum]EFA00359.1 Queuine tRNA-ribosyltransferase subunit QTRTD1 homolog-like Protein [Tribolium castaneum]|eukprot:XP_971899.1 PREDICTED: queuine tRNA-ribosyltransferase subunit QTRTD1 homolog [Tribolium castaneum]